MVMALILDPVVLLQQPIDIILRFTLNQLNLDMKVVNKCLHKVTKRLKGTENRPSRKHLKLKDTKRQNADLLGSYDGRTRREILQLNS